jgi:O-antigen/teichoic acid export membrane protein
VSSDAENRSVIKRLLANTGLLLGGRGANALLGLGYLALAARTLGVTVMGDLILINSFTQLVGDLVKFNSWQTVLHYGARPFAEGGVRQLQRVIRFTLALDVISGIVGAAVAVVAALLVGQHLGWSRADNSAAALYSLSIIIMAPATPIGLLRLFNRFDLIASQAPVSSAVRLVGGGLAFFLGGSLTDLLWVWALGTLASFLYIASVSVLEMRRRGLLRGFHWTGPLTAGMPGAWRFAWATNFSSSLDTAFTHVITLAIGAVTGASDAALWRIGRQVADALAKPARLLVPALYPELARLQVTQGEKAMRRLAWQVGVFGGAAGSILLLISATLGRPLLSLILGKAWGAAAGVMTWQVAAAVLGIWALPLEPMLVSLGRPGDALKVRIGVSALLLATLPFAIRSFGLTGAGACLVVAMAALAVGMFAMLQRGSARPNSAVTAEST